MTTNVFGRTNHEHGCRFVEELRNISVIAAEFGDAYVVVVVEDGVFVDDVGVGGIGSIIRAEEQGDTCVYDFCLFVVLS